MNALRPPLALVAGLAFLSGGATIPAREELPKRYEGRITFRGEMQNEAKPGSFSFVAKGKLTHAGSGDVVTVTMGGLFRSRSSRIVRTTYTGRMKLYVNNRGELTSTNKKVRIKVFRRSARIPGGTLRFARPPKGDVATMQRVRGFGRFHVSS